MTKNIKPVEECKDFFEYRKQFSTYHFNHQLQNSNDHGCFKIIGRYVGDWQPIQDDMKQCRVEINSNNTDKHGRIISDKSQATDKLREAQDKMYANYGTDRDNTFEINQIRKEKHPVLWKMANDWGLEDIYVKIHNQKPGQIFTYHLDKSSSGYRGPQTYADIDPEKIVRLFIFLDDWRPGQHICMGQTQLYWKRGDVLWFDWQNAAHGTANCSHYDRPMLLVTGIKTQKFLEIFYKFTQVEIQV